MESTPSRTDSILAPWCGAIAWAGHGWGFSHHFDVHHPDVGSDVGSLPAAPGGLSVSLSGLPIGVSVSQVFPRPFLLGTADPRRTVSPNGSVPRPGSLGGPLAHPCRPSGLWVVRHARKTNGRSTEERVTDRPSSVIDLQGDYNDGGSRCLPFCHSQSIE